MAGSIGQVDPFFKSVRTTSRLTAAFCADRPDSGKAVGSCLTGLPHLSATPFLASKPRMFVVEMATLFVPAHADKSRTRRHGDPRKAGGCWSNFDRECFRLGIISQYIFIMAHSDSIPVQLVRRSTQLSVVEVYDRGVEETR